ncbi:hypothetical protein ACGFY9_47440 [Streptomyces sp. NPDC048504]|uniref:hypothetical protein n=1 Tax=Streptomyces sp. NPDC048504 TaxID=3365559 RepID=UPI003721F0CE
MRTDCVRIAPAAGSPVAIASDNAGAPYLAYSGGDLLKLDLATGALDTVTTGLGNLRGVAALDQSVARTAETLGIPPGTSSPGRTLPSGLSGERLPSAGTPP